MTLRDWGPLAHVLGGYREYAAPPDLARFVDAVWTYALPPHADTGGVRHDVLPDSGLSLCFWRRGAGRGAAVDLVVVGPVHTVQCFLPERGAVLEAVRLRPEWCQDLLGIDPREHGDAVDRLHAVRRRDADRLTDALAHSGGVGAGLRILLDELRRRSARSLPRAAVLAGLALDRLRGGRDPGTRLGSVAADLGVSARHLRRVIRRTTGSGPKTHQRVARLNRAVAAADREPDPNWSRLAVRCGFYDQSHLIQEFRALAGERPVALHRMRRHENLALAGDVSGADRRDPLATTPGHGPGHRPDSRSSDLPRP